MLFSKPIGFKEAQDSLAVKSLLPNGLSSKELSKVAPEVRERAVFSANTMNAEHLQTIADVLKKIVIPVQATRSDGSPVTQGLDMATARTMLQDSLDSIGYQPGADIAGTMEDLSSDQRLNLILDTNVRMAQGYGDWMQGQDADILDLWPAQELYRAEDRKEPRDWPARWEAAGGTFYEGDRMIAAKDDPIWEKISAFGLPYAPFDYNSGMDLMDIDRDEAESLGVIEKDQTVDPQMRDFNDDLESSGPARDEALKEALLASMGDGYEFDGDTLKRAA